MSELYTLTDNDGDEVAIHAATAVDNAVYVLSGGTSPAIVTKDEAPAFALALLEGTGWTADSLGGPVEHALKGLSKHIQNVADAEEAARKAAEEEARKAAEEEARKAEEAASLEAEALQLFNAYRLKAGRYTYESLHQIRASAIREQWLAIAEAARAVHATPTPEPAPEPPARFSLVPSEKRIGQIVLLDAERPNMGAAFYGDESAQNGLEAAKRGIRYFFEPLSNHF